MERGHRQEAADRAKEGQQRSWSGWLSSHLFSAAEALRVRISSKHSDWGCEKPHIPGSLIRCGKNRTSWEKRDGVSAMVGAATYRVLSGTGAVCGHQLARSGGAADI